MIVLFPLAAEHNMKKPALACYDSYCSTSDKRLNTLMWNVMLYQCMLTAQT